MENSLFKTDLYRYYGDNGETLKNRILRPRELKYLYVLRKLQSNPNIVSKLYYKLRLRRLSAKTFIQIPSSTKIGEGFYIGHCGRIIVNPRSVIGKNVNIATGVTIGQENRGKRKGSPTIGDNCWIGTNAVIVGNIKIGNDVLIAPLSYVNFDVPDHSIVIGNPAKIVHRENATEGYINFTV
jgi:serine O-acetyltransferase